MSYAGIPDAIITRDVNRYYGDPTVFPVRRGASVCGRRFRSIYYDETINPDDIDTDWFVTSMLTCLGPDEYR